MRNLILLIFLGLFYFSFSQTKQNQIPCPENFQNTIILFPEPTKNNFVLDSISKINLKLEIIFFVPEKEILNCNKYLENFLADSLQKIKQRAKKHTEIKKMLESTILNTETNVDVYIKIKSSEFLSLLSNYFSGNSITVWKKIPNGHFQRSITRDIPFPTEAYYPQTNYLKTFSKNYY